MKKLFATLLSAALSFSLVSCTPALDKADESAKEIVATSNFTMAPTAAPTTRSTAAPTTKSTVAPTTKSTVAPTTKSTVAPTTKSTDAPTTKNSSLNHSEKENYHGHIYTGGDSSKKYHYEERCPGKNSHEITWEEVERRNLGPCGTCVLK